LRTANFNDGQAQGFAHDSGTWSVTGGRYQVAPANAGGDAVSVFYVDSFIPNYYELTATMNAVKPTGGFNANAYLILDYQSPSDFKFAGINVSTNKLEIGHRNQQGWIIDKQGVFPGSVKADTDYSLFLALNGSNATLIVNNQVTLTYQFAPRIDAYGIKHGLNDGMVGLGANNAKAQIDNVTVQRVAPATTLSTTVDFSSGTTSLLQSPLSGAWLVSGGRNTGTASTSAPAITLLAPRISTSALIDLSATFRVGGEGGFIFDRYSDNDFKFVTIASGNITLGHRTANGWVIDATYSSANLKTGVDYTVGLTLSGSTVGVTLNGQNAMSRAFSAPVTDGGFGLLSRSGTTSFDKVTFKSNDPALLNRSYALTAESAPSGSAEPIGQLAESQVAAVASEAIREWNEVNGGARAELLNSIQFHLVDDLPGNALAWSVGDGNILIDMNAAGYGWFVDNTPLESSEYRFSNGVWLAGADSAAYGRMDLLTTFMHEIGHVLGYEHGADALMSATLAAGTRALEGGSQARPYEPANEIITFEAVERDNPPGVRPFIDWDMEIPSLSTPLGWSNGWVKRGSGANFLEFVYSGLDNQDGEVNNFGQKKKRLDEVDQEVVFEAQGQIDWRIEI
jgi:hypothetical protein